MPKTRIEAFSDGVLAIVITLLVLELHVPNVGKASENRALLTSLLQLAPSFVAYITSFLVCAVWWVSHHNFIHDLVYVDQALLWGNNLFLLWLHSCRFRQHYWASIRRSPWLRRFMARLVSCSWALTAE